MADKSSIEWTDATWNVVTGCSRVSRGCENCWAEREASRRLKHHPSRQGLTDRNGRWTGKARFNEQWLDRPLRWRKPRKIFVAASGDLFHEDIPNHWLDRIFGVMALADIHVFQVLTKRPSRAREYLAGGARDRILPKINRCFNANGMPARDWPLSNVWIGTSVEDQPTADERIATLLQIEAAVRWVSIEPLLGPVEIDEFLWADSGRPRLDWVVAGGESGPGARPMDPSWPRSLRNQCICARVPYFFKQWGGITAKAGGSELDGRQWRQMPGGLA